MRATSLSCNEQGVYKSCLCEIDVLGHQGQTTRHHFQTTGQQERVGEGRTLVLCCFLKLTSSSRRKRERVLWWAVRRMGGEGGGGGLLKHAAIQLTAGGSAGYFPQPTHFCQLLFHYHNATLLVRSTKFFNFHPARRLNLTTLALNCTQITTKTCTINKQTMQKKLYP